MTDTTHSAPPVSARSPVPGTSSGSTEAERMRPPHTDGAGTDGKPAGAATTGEAAATAVGRAALPARDVHPRVWQRRMAVLRDQGRRRSAG